MNCDQELSCTIEETEWNRIPYDIDSLQTLSSDLTRSQDPVHDVMCVHSSSFAMQVTNICLEKVGWLLLFTIMASIVCVFPVCLVVSW